LSAFHVVVNDCAGVDVIGGPLAIRTRDTPYGNQNFILNYAHLARGLPRQLSDRELDWIETIGNVFAVDLACRRAGGDLAWPREIEAYLPVRDPSYWSGVRHRLERIFRDFTSDRLRLTFVADVAPAPAPRQHVSPFPEHDSVALFSGGVDSFVGTAALIADGRQPLGLSHTAAGAITHAQARAEAVMADRMASFERLGLTARKNGQSFPPAEPSQRSRSFLFLAAACVVAAVGGSGQVFINENGVMAIHVPLTAARIGSLSTHTAAPVVLQRVADLASDVLESHVSIDNLLLPLTKPEVVRLAVELGVDHHLQETVSCWSIGRTSAHCGTCAPCLMRRVSFETHGIPDAPCTDDILNDHLVLDKDFAVDNLTHLVRLIDQIQNSTDLALQIAYPELLNGGSALPATDALGLYRRWADEAASVLYSHPVPASLR